MLVDTIAADFRSKVCEQVRVVAEGQQRFRVFTPFLHDDGDHLTIVLKAEKGGWVLTDEGNTYMRLTYDIAEADLRKGTRGKLIANLLAEYSIRDREGELVVPCQEGSFGNCLYSFIQGLVRIGDVCFLSREKVRSLFYEDLMAFLSASIPEERRVFKWHDSKNDPDAKYAVDCRVNHMQKPVMIFALQNDDQVATATISLLQFERWGLRHLGLGVFQDQESINRKTLARFSDVCEKQFSSLASNKDRIKNYLHELMERSLRP